MKIRNLIFVLFVSLAMLGSCKKDTVYTPDCTGGTKSFATDVLPLIQNNCESCHASYSNYSQISGSKSSIRSKIVDGSMPPGASLSTDQKNIIVCWIDNGALNN
jgi:hypothetical protein